MIPELRKEFNSKVSDTLYARQRADLERRGSCEIPFRIAETPLFIPKDFAERAASTAEAILLAAQSPELQKIGVKAIPADYNVAGETEHPIFAAVDFAITGSAEDPQLKLIELQGFPSLYHFQPVFSQSMRDVYGLDPSLSGLLRPQLGYDSYYELLRQAIVGNHSPEEVVLLEVDPFNQKTYIDFSLAKQSLGIAIVDIEQIVCEGDKLFSRDGHGSLTRIKRIYNRSIHDEIARKNIRVPFDVSKPLDVEWAGHPNWYFRISKILLPYLQGVSDAVPQAMFLSETDPAQLDLDRFVLKPLYSFAGAGVIVAPSLADVRAVPQEQRGDWVLQERVNYAEVIHSPEGFGVKAELRVMLVWPEHTSSPIATHTLVRLARGKMMGVDFNKGLEWVGSSCGLVG